MSDEVKVDCTRRRLLMATATAGGAATIMTMVPFVKSMSPSERALAAGAPVEVDISNLGPGEMKTIEWRGKPVWIINRTPEMLATLPKLKEKLADPLSERKQDELTPEYARNEHRSIKEKYLVTIGICSHLGCSPTEKFVPGAEGGVAVDWPGGFVCPCHGSYFDLAGRVYKGMPAPDNLEVPPHKYLSDTRLIIGVDSEKV